MENQDEKLLEQAETENPKEVTPESDTIKVQPSDLIEEETSEDLPVNETVETTEAEVSNEVVETKEDVAPIEEIQIEH